MPRGTDERLTSSDEVVLISALSGYITELSNLIESLELAGPPERVAYWRGRRDKVQALYSKLSGAVSITVRVVTEDVE